MFTLASPDDTLYSEPAIKNRIPCWIPSKMSELYPIHNGTVTLCIFLFWWAQHRTDQKNEWDNKELRHVVVFKLRYVLKGQALLEFR